MNAPPLDERISREYLQIQQEFHTNRKDYGSSGYFHAIPVTKLARDLRTFDILDYGCGKGMLDANMPCDIQQYDPCIPKWANEPIPADIVVCTDVLEHIEPDKLDAVLQHIHSLTLQRAYLSPATRAANKHLPDGRNVHLIIEEEEWWLDKIGQHFEILEKESGKYDHPDAPKEVSPYFNVLCKPKVI